MKKLKGKGFHNRFSETQLPNYQYPEEVTKDNIHQLVDRAIFVKRKTGISFFVIGTFFGLFSVFLAVLMQWIINYLNTNPLPESTPLTTSLTILAVSLLILEFVILILFDLVETIVNKILRVDYRESLFANCILIAKYSFSEERNKACKEVNGFIVSLLGVKRTTGREYDKEINHLANGRKQIRRMLTFSEEKNPELLLAFSSSIYRNDHPMAYLYLKQVINNAEKYGNLEGLLRRIDNNIRSLKGIITLISTLVAISVGLWTIFH